MCIFLTKLWYFVMLAGKRRDLATYAGTGTDVKALLGKEYVDIGETLLHQMEEGKE